MKNISKRIIVTVIMILTILMGVKSVNAADPTVKMSLTSSSKLKAGQTVTINVNYTQSVTGGIGSILGTLDYDPNVLEYVDTKVKGDWKAGVYTASTKILGIERNNNTETTGTIAEVIFKVKESSTAKSTTITYNVTDVGLADEVKLSPSVTIDAEKEATGNEVGTNTPAGTNSTNTNKTNPIKNTTTNAPKNITTSKTNSSKLPAAGDSTTMAIIAIIAVVAVVGIVGFIKYSKEKDIK